MHLKSLTSLFMLLHIVSCELEHPNKNNRDLLFFQRSDVSIESPSNGTEVVANALEVEVSYGLSPSFFSFFQRFSRVELVLDSVIVATKKSSFLGLPFSSGQETFSVNLTDLKDGNHVLQANAYLGFGLFGRTKNSQEVIVSLDRTPPLVKNFTKSTFVPGGTRGSNETVDDSEDVSFNINFNYTLRDNGVVSLSQALSLLESVSCFEDATVSVIFRQSVEEGFLNSMFPTNALLVIDGAEFGSCYLGFDDDDIERSYYTDIFANSTEDGFLIINKISIGGSGKEVVIRGNRSSYLDMFSFFNMTTLPLDFDIIETDDIERRLLSDPVYKTVNKDYALKETSFPSATSSLLKSTVKGNINIRAGVGYQILKDALTSGFSAKAFVDGAIVLTKDLRIDWKPGDKNWNEDINLLKSFQLIELPVPKKLFFLKIVAPKAGVYLDVSTFAKYSFRSSEAGSMTVNTKVTLGGKRVSLFATAKLFSKPEASLGKKQSTKPFLSVIPKVTTTISDKTEASFNAQSGIQVGLFLSAFGLKIGVFQNALIEFDTTAVSADENAIGATSSKGIVVGDCTKCHRIDSRAEFRLDPLQWSASASFLRKKFGGEVIPSIYQIELASICQLPVELPKCGKVCCAGDLECYEGVCRIPLRPPPTSPPVRPPTSPPLRPPTSPPLRTPTSSPLRTPTSSPLRAPTKAPTKLPTKSPLRPPTKAPTKLPVRPPTKAPTKSPVRPPTRPPSVIIVI